MEKEILALKDSKIWEFVSLVFGKEPFNASGSMR